MRGYEQETTNLRRHRDIPEETERRERRTESDSDSDGSEGRSLELASSHSSDDDESSSRRHHRSRNTTGEAENTELSLTNDSCAVAVKHHNLKSLQNGLRLLTAALQPSFFND